MVKTLAVIHQPQFLKHPSNAFMQTMLIILIKEAQWYSETFLHLISVQSD